MIRLYLPEGEKFSQQQSHYINHVMRKSHKDSIKCFNENGEWLCDIKGNRIRQLRQAEVRPTRIIGIGCIKKNRLEILVEKITEIGITELQLLNTEYSQRISYDMARFNRISIEAAEQSGWLGPIRILGPISLADFLNSATHSELVFCHGEDKLISPPLDTLNQVYQPLIEGVDNKDNKNIRTKVDPNYEEERIKPEMVKPNKAQSSIISASTILIGPEGGWSPQELIMMKRLPKLNLGTSILRSETAAIVASYWLISLSTEVPL